MTDKDIQAGADAAQKAADHLSQMKHYDHQMQKFMHAWARRWLPAKAHKCLAPASWINREGRHMDSVRRFLTNPENVALVFRQGGNCNWSLAGTTSLKFQRSDIIEFFNSTGDEKIIVVSQDTRWTYTAETTATGTITITKKAQPLSKKELK